jgi:hypothetical protein
LDTDGIAETTVAYQVQCAGGIDPIPTKAIMREGDAKYAIRGESIIRIKGVAPFGGDFTPDPTLDKYPVFKTHLVSIWKKAAGIDP